MVIELKKVEWIELKLDISVYLSVNKYFCPTEAQIYMSSVCYPSSTDVDILVILGEPIFEEAEYYVLAALFLKNHILSNFDHSKNNQLFDHLRNLLPKMGYETARTGGALGLCLKSAYVRKSLYMKGRFPRQIQLRT